MCVCVCVCVETQELATQTIHHSYTSLNIITTSTSILLRYLLTSIIKI